MIWLYGRLPARAVVVGIIVAPSAYRQTKINVNRHISKLSHRVLDIIKEGPSETKKSLRNCFKHADS